MDFPLSGSGVFGGTLVGSIGWGVSAAITFIISLWLFKRCKNEQSKTFKYFALFIGARFLLFLFIALAPVIYLVTGNLVLAGTAITMLYTFMFVSFLFLPLLFTSFKWPGLKKYYFGLMLLLVITGIGMAVASFEPAFYVPEAQAVLQKTPNLMINGLYPVAKILSVLPLAILFLGYSITSPGMRLKARGFLMGLGLLWVITTIIVPTLIPPLWAGMYCSVGDILIFLGLMIRPKQQTAAKKFAPQMIRPQPVV